MKHFEIFDAFQRNLFNALSHGNIFMCVDNEKQTDTSIDRNALEIKTPGKMCRYCSIVDAYRKIYVDVAMLQEVVEQRNLNGTCGYLFCHKASRKRVGTSTYKIDLESMRIIPRNHYFNFCSVACIDLHESLEHDAANSRIETGEISPKLVKSLPRAVLDQLFIPNAFCFAAAGNSNCANDLGLDVDISHVLDISQPNRSCASSPPASMQKPGQPLEPQDKRVTFAADTREAETEYSSSMNQLPPLAFLSLVLCRCVTNATRRFMLEQQVDVVPPMQMNSCDGEKERLFLICKKLVPNHLTHVLEAVQTLLYTLDTLPALDDHSGASQLRECLAKIFITMLVKHRLSRQCDDADLTHLVLQMDRSLVDDHSFDEDAMALVEDIIMQKNR